MSSCFLYRVKLFADLLFSQHAAEEIAVFADSGFVQLAGIFADIGHQAECIYNGLLGHNDMDAVCAVGFAVDVVHPPALGLADQQLGFSGLDDAKKFNLIFGHKESAAFLIGNCGFDNGFQIFGHGD